MATAGKQLNPVSCLEVKFRKIPHFSPDYTSEFKDNGVDVPATKEDGPNDVKQTSASDDDEEQQEDDGNYSNQLDLGLEQADEDKYFE